MGNYLGSKGAPPKSTLVLPAPAEDRLSWRPRPDQGPWQTPNLDPGSWRGPQGNRRSATYWALVAQGRFPNQPPSLSVGTPAFSGLWETYLHHRLALAHHRRSTRSPVKVRILPPPRRGALDTMRFPPEQRPDPCATETVLEALRQCSKGKKKFDGPLWFEVPEVAEVKRRVSPEEKPSDFSPVVKNGVARAFVPMPGRLNGCRCSRRVRSSQAQLCPSAFRPVIKNGKIRALVPRPGRLNGGRCSWKCSVCHKWCAAQPAPSAAQPSRSAHQPADARMPASSGP